MCDGYQSGRYVLDVYSSPIDCLACSAFPLQIWTWKKCGVIARFVIEMLNQIEHQVSGH